MSMFRSFITSELHGTQLIEEYVPLCNKLLFENPSTICLVIDKLQKNIIDYATKYSLSYKDFQHNRIYDRTQLSHNNWYVDQLIRENQIFHTSGSSSGQPFSYGVWNKYISFLEDACHYGMILDEFTIDKNKPKILMLKKLAYNPQHSEFLHEQKGPSPYTLHTHKSINSIRYFVKFDNYMTESDAWFDKVFEHTRHLMPFDIVMITGPIMSFLVRYLKKNSITIKIAKLMSQTGEFMRDTDKQYLIDNNYAEHVCNHMRCWDGGSSFFTCQYNTYHLLDNISWTRQGPDNKLICTDYFNFSAPFINYWNGDLCEIKDEYKLCECGRWYRPFKMLQNRPFALKGPTKLTEIREKIRELDFKSSIDQVQFENLIANVYLKNRLDERCINKLKEILSDYEVKIYE